MPHSRVTDHFGNGEIRLLCIADPCNIDGVSVSYRINWDLPQCVHCYRSRLGLLPQDDLLGPTNFTPLTGATSNRRLTSDEAIFHFVSSRDFDLLRLLGTHVFPTRQF